MPTRIVHVAGTARKIAQLTGELDRERREPTRSLTESRFGVVGTDLGASFEHDGRLYFLFGDTIPRPDVAGVPARPLAGDSIAWTTDTAPEDLSLTFVTAKDGAYRSPKVQRTSLGPFEVPTTGFSHGGLLYAVFTTDHFVEDGKDLMGQSVLASAAGPGRTFTRHHVISDRREASRGGFKFINVSAWPVDAATLAGLPISKGKGFLLWGSGRYRQSDVYLAFVAASGLGERTSLRFYAGLRANGAPAWSKREADAVPLLGHSVVGELSATWNGSLSCWLLLYNARRAGIVYRTAKAPWGPYSPIDVLFDPWTDGGYCHFIHTSHEVRTCDQVHDPGRENEWGGNYGPYQIARFAQGDAAAARVYFVLSTWNPYNTVLMTSTLRVAAEDEPFGNPVLVHGRFGTRGNFEVVTPRAGGGLAHAFRNNDDPQLPWSPFTPFGQGAGQVEAASMIQGNFGAHGNLEVVARVGDKLALFWRDSAPSWAWNGPYPLVADGTPVSGVTGNPVLLQGKLGTKGHFELLVPRADGGLYHLFRDNDAPDMPWHGPVLVAPEQRFSAIAFIQSTFSPPGNLEVLARVGDELVFLFRESAPPFTWHGPFAILADGKPVTGLCGTPALIQGTFGKPGNFEVVIPSMSGGLVHLWRDNTQAGFPWHGPFAFGTGAGRFDAVSLVQSRLDDGKGLEVIARRGARLCAFHRDGPPSFAWHGPVDILGA